MCKQSEQSKEKTLHLRATKKKISLKARMKKKFLNIFCHMEITIEKG